MATVEAMTALVPLWIDLEGAENVRDLGGLPTRDGRTVRPGRLIRSDSLQELTPADVRLLVDELGVRTVVDLRTLVEVDTEGPGPLHDDPRVEVRHLSLLPEEGDATDAAATGTDAPVVLPWQKRDETLDEDERRRGAAAVYQRYLGERSDSIVEALRVIAHGDGATIVHCAAGKDRTGTVVAMALDAVGVDRDAIVADYARSAERVPRVFARLAQRRTYAGDLAGHDSDIDRHKPQAVTMQRLLDTLDERHGGAAGWLRQHGWTEADDAALNRTLLG